MSVFKFIAKTPNLGLLLTYQCNRACKFCGTRSTGDRTWPYMNVQLARRTLREAGQEGFTSVYLSGGNPLLHTRVAAIVEAAAENGFTKVEVLLGGWTKTENLVMKQRVGQILDVAEANDLRCSFPLSFSPLANSGNTELNIDTWTTTVSTLLSFGDRIAKKISSVQCRFVLSPSGQGNSQFLSLLDSVMEQQGAKHQLFDDGHAEPSRIYSFSGSNLAFNFDSRVVGFSGNGENIPATRPATCCNPVNYGQWLLDMAVTPSGGFQPCDVVKNEADQAGALIDLKAISAEPLRFSYEWYRDNRDRLATRRRQIYRTMDQQKSSFHDACAKARRELLAEDGISVL